MECYESFSRHWTYERLEIFIPPTSRVLALIAIFRFIARIRAIDPRTGAGSQPCRWGAEAPRGAGGLRIRWWMKTGLPLNNCEMDVQF